MSSPDHGSSFRTQHPRDNRPGRRKEQHGGTHCHSRPGGAFDIFHRLARWGLAGPQGPGSQFVSWIHEADFARAVDWIITHPQLDGPVNCAGPHPLRNQEFLSELRRAGGQRIGLPATRWMLKLGAILLRTETELILKSRRVIPGKLVQSGFEFRYSTWPEAVRAILKHNAAAKRR